MLKIIFEKYGRSLINTMDLLEQFTKVTLSSTTQEQTHPDQQRQQNRLDTAKTQPDVQEQLGLTAQEQLKHTAQEQPKHASQEQQKRSAKEQPKHKTQEQPWRVVQEQSKHTVQDQLKLTAQEQPRHAKQEQPRHAAQEQRRHATQEQTRHATQEQPKHIFQKQPNHTAQEQPRQATHEQPRHAAQEQRKHATQGQTKHATQEQPQHTVQEQLWHATQVQPRYAAQEQTKHSVQEQPKHVTQEQPEQTLQGHKVQQHSVSDTVQEHTVRSVSKSGSSVLIIGGYTNPNAYHTRTWLLNLQTQTATEKSPMPINLFGVTICAVPQGAICLGGTPTKLMKDASDQCLLYDKYKDEWLPLRRVPYPITSARATCVKGRFVYVIGGQEPRSKSTICFDLQTKTWKRCPDMKQGIAWPLIGCIKDSIYVIFLTILTNTTKHRKSIQDIMVQQQFSYDNNQREIDLTVQCFNMLTQSWSFVASLAESIDTRGANTVTLEDMLYLVGGNGKLCLKYDPQVNTWTMLTGHPLEPHYGPAVALGHKIYISGGFKNLKMTDSFEMYDPSTDTWEVLPVKLPVPLCRHAMIPF